MAVPISQQLRVGSYLADCRVKGIKKPPLVLMLEPSFKTNIQKNVCGKTDYPEAVLNESLSPEKCVYSSDECGAPIVSISGGEPLLNSEMPEIVKSLLKKKKFIYLCTNGLLLSKSIFDYESSPYLTITIDLDGIEEEHDKIAGQAGVYENAVQSIRLAKTKGSKWVLLA
jgi:hopanoid biosynthesis associated radical SAM protein HpnH